MTEHRIEKDTFGEIDVPADRLWGAQTERSLQHFEISTEKMPIELIRALALVKRSAAVVNRALGMLDAEEGRRDHRRRRRGDRRQARRRVPARRLADRHRHADQHEHERGDRQPRLELLGGARGEGAPGPPERPRQPQPVVERRLPDGDARRRGRGARRAGCIPPVAALRDTLAQQGRRRSPTIVKIGRTHLQDATPLTLGQEISGWVAQLDHGLAHVARSACRTCASSRSAARPSAPA